MPFTKQMEASGDSSIVHGPSTVQAIEQTNALNEHLLEVKAFLMLLILYGGKCHTYL